jgi:hypothetical protein
MGGARIDVFSYEIVDDAADDLEPAPTTARMCDCGNDTVIPGTRLCKECAWAGITYPHLFPEDKLNAEIDRLRAENARLNAVNAAQSDMLKGAALAAAEVTQERDALRKALEQMPKYQLGQTVSVGEWSPSVGTIEEIRINDDGIEYSVYVDSESMPYTWSENNVTPIGDLVETSRANLSADQKRYFRTRHQRILNILDSGNIGLLNVMSAHVQFLSRFGVMRFDEAWYLYNNTIEDADHA